MPYFTYGRARHYKCGISWNSKVRSRQKWVTSILLLEGLLRVISWMLLMLKNWEKNKQHAKTISRKLTPLICTSLTLICSLLFYRREPIRAPFIQESFEPLLYSLISSLLRLISMIITLFFKLKHSLHIFIFKILSFLERETYNPQTVKAWRFAEGYKSS